MSWGIPGIRFGISPSGRKYISVGFPSTGLYYIKYLSTGESPKELLKENSHSNKIKSWTELK